MSENEIREAEPEVEAEAVEPEQVEADEPEADEIEAEANDDGAEPEPQPEPDRREEDGKLKAIARERDRRRKAEREAEALRLRLAEREHADLKREMDRLDPADFDTDEDFEARRAALAKQLDEAAPRGDPGLAEASRELTGALEDADPSLLTAVQKMRVFTAPMIEYAAEAEDPIALMRYLVAHPEEADAFAGRTPTRTILALQKIERRIMSEPQGQKGQQAPRRTTEAPDPIDPVRPTPGAQGGNLAKLARDEDITRFSAELRKGRTGAPKPANRSW